MCLADRLRVRNFLCSLPLRCGCYVVGFWSIVFVITDIATAAINFQYTWVGHSQIVYNISFCLLTTAFLYGVWGAVPLWVFLYIITYIVSVVCDAIILIGIHYPPEKPKGPKKEDLTEGLTFFYSARVVLKIYFIFIMWSFLLLLKEEFEESDDDEP